MLSISRLHIFSILRKIMSSLSKGSTKNTIMLQSLWMQDLHTKIYLSGTVFPPSEDVLEEFFRQVEATNGVVAVHCSGRITVGITCIRMDTYGSQLVNNVKLVIRFNEKYYNAAEFMDAGFAHKDLFIRDGFPPKWRCSWRIFSSSGSNKWCGSCALFR